MYSADLFMHPELTPAALLHALRGCVGEAHGATAEQLVTCVTGRTHARPSELRHMRKIIEALRGAGHPVCAHPAHGYYLAANGPELERGCRFLRDRAMTSLRQESAMRRISLGDLIGQLRLPEGNQP